MDVMFESLSSAFPYGPHLIKDLSVMFTQEALESSNIWGSIGVLEHLRKRTVLGDCAKDDPEMNEEMTKDIITLLTEEISLHKSVSDDNLAHTKALVMDARKSSSQYQKEAEKCITGMETCEEAREKAGAALSEEHKLSALWEIRARNNGWMD
ncbi:hypothetical protein AgCh_000674 [Apium graveolens]